MYVYGKNVAKEVINSKTKIKEALIYKQSKDIEIINKLKENKIKIQYKEKYELDRIDKNNQGIILNIEDYKYVTLDEIIEKNELIIILDHIEDPHNFGAIIRTCESAGINGIIIPKDRSVEVNSTVMKTSVGTLEHIQISRVTNLKVTIDYLKKQGYWIIGTDMQGEDYRTLDYSGKTCIIIGNEGKGMSRLVKESCDFIASIPMKGTVNSLNASVATGIIIYEAIKKR